MTFSWDDFVLDAEAYRLERAGVPLALEPKAFDVLVLLVQRAGKLVTKQEILEVVWPQTAVTDYALTRVVAQLRKVLGDEVRETRFIETVPTRGYRWIRPLTPLHARCCGPCPSMPLPCRQRQHRRLCVTRLMSGEYLRRVEGIGVAVVIVILIGGYVVSSRQSRSEGAAPATLAATKRPDCVSRATDQRCRTRFAAGTFPARRRRRVFLGSIGPARDLRARAQGHVDGNAADAGRRRERAARVVSRRDHGGVSLV